MIPIEQSNPSYENGDCFNACLASVLEIPLEEIPSFMQSEDWYTEYNNWLRKYGLYLLGLKVNENSDFQPRGYSILSGKTNRGSVLHSVVCYDGLIIHDPHPDKSGIIEPIDWIVFQALNPEDYYSYKSFKVVICGDSYAF